MASPSAFRPESLPAIDGSLIPAGKFGQPHSHRDVSKAKRLSTAVEKTVDKLSKSVGGTASCPTSQARRVFSLSRKKQLSVPEPTIGGCPLSMRSPTNVTHSFRLKFRVHSDSN